MPSPRPVIRWPGRKPRSAPIPLARDPFVNTPLLRLTPDAKGLDRFWISSWNSASGSLGVCVNEMGEARLYPFGSRHSGFYSVAQTGPDTLWLCGDLARVVCLDLKSGTFEAFETGAPSALVFAGMVYDASTGKLFAVAYPPPKTVAFSFNINTRKTEKIYELPTIDHYQRSSYAHGDGTYSIELQCPGLTFVRWNPAEETTTLFPVTKDIDMAGNASLVYQVIAGDDGRLYLPGFGWYDPRTGAVGPGPKPADDTVAWFDRDATHAYGHKLGSSLFRRWNLKSGEVSDIGDFPGTDLNYMCTTLTRSGKLVGVSKAGLFSRLDARTGELEMSRLLPTDSVQPADCVIRIDRDRVLGTPFITQRFWETNLRTKKGFDCGAAAPGCGEVLQVWRLGGKIYMAAYTGSELMEYDPAVHPHFPENPRVVARPPTGMRPVGAADDGRRIFYTCSHHYGHLGSVVARYDTKTGLAFYKDNPLPDQQITGLCYEKSSDSLIGGTTFHADCESAPPKADRTVIARLDAGTLEVREQCPGPAGAVRVNMIGPMGRHRWLGIGSGVFDGVHGCRWFVFDAAAFRTPGPEELRPFEGWWGSIKYAGKPGLFVLKTGNRIELWDMRKPERLKVLADSPHLHHFFVQGQDLLIWNSRDVFVLENALV
jgi:hypothetical protein